MADLGSQKQRLQLLGLLEAAIGFDIVNSRDIATRGDPIAGNLAARRYFAVALYRGSGGHWICPDYTHDDRDSKLGELSNLCYGEDGPPAWSSYK